MNDLVEEVSNDPEFGKRYELTGRLGEGGMGTVHRGTHRLLGRPVAIKFMRPEFLTEEVPRQRFLSEARTAAGLIHPNVCVVLDFGFAGRVPFLVTELVDGTSLQNLMLKAPSGLLEPSLVLAIVGQMLDGLEAIHALGVVHRDLKPANVVVTKDHRAKILDFGQAKPYQNTTSSGATLPGTVVGTPAYISPEQGTAGKLAPSSDLYALAVIVYEMVVGHLPFRSDNAQDVIKMHVYDEPVLPDYLLASVRAMLKRGLTKRPRDRYQSAAEFRADLEAVEAAVAMAHGFARAPVAPLVEPPTDPGDVSLTPAPAPVEPPPPPPPEPPPISRPAAGHQTMQALSAAPKRPWPFLEVGVGAIVLIAGLWLTAPRSDPTPAPSRSADASAPRTFYAQLDQTRRQLAEGKLGDLTAGFAALQRFRASPPDATESAELDELLLNAIELACRTTPDATPSMSGEDYATLVTALAPEIKQRRAHVLAETVKKARWATLHPGDALDFLRGSALVMAAMLPSELKEGMTLLRGCVGGHERHVVGLWSREILAELDRAAGGTKVNVIHSADDRYPQLQAYRLGVNHHIMAQLARGGRNNLLKRALAGER